MGKNMLIGILLCLLIFAAVIAVARQGVAEKPGDVAYEAVAIRNTAEHTKFLFHCR